MTKKLLCLLWIAASVALAGCAGSGQGLAINPKPGPDAELVRYQDGLRSFADGEYAKAIGYLEPIAFASSNQDLRLRALYSLACARLITANTLKEFDDAVNLWYAWSNASAYSSNYPDPKLMAPLIEFLRPTFTEDCGDDTDLEEEIPVEQPKKAEKAAPKPKPEKRDLECRKQLQTTEKKVKRLQEQLNALEAIHQEIREKKKEIYPK